MQGFPHPEGGSRQGSDASSIDKSLSQSDGSPCRPDFAKGIIMGNNRNVTLSAVHLIAPS